jgi:ATP-dependent Lon protease
MMLTRLLPFAEKRLNLIELAPKGTGKSYLFSKISKRGWLASGGIMTRAKMFYDMAQKREGLVSFYDYVALDEISTIKFGDINEMRGAMKGYLESGSYTVGAKAGSGDAGLVLLGNIRQEDMNEDTNMFLTLPEVFGDSALIDRFHGFIEGWRIPRMNEKMKVRGWALNTEYFAEILHAMRDDLFAKSVVDKLVDYPADADTRDTAALKRIASGFVKLLFPHWMGADDADREAFEKYCLKPAVRMRGIIRKQLAIMDAEYAKPIAEYTVVPAPDNGSDPPNDPPSGEASQVES